MSVRPGSDGDLLFLMPTSLLRATAAAALMQASAGTLPQVILQPAVAGALLPAPFVSFGCAGIAGAVGAAAVYPLDFAKTLLQTKEGAGLYSNSLEALHKTVKQRGVTSVYRGVGTQMAGVAPEKAIKIFVNDIARTVLADASGGSLSLVAEMSAGCIAGCTQVAVTNPLEALKVRLQTSDETLGGVVRDLGLSGLYNGAGACLLRDGCFSAILFPIYHNSKHLVTSSLGISEDAVAALVVAGFVAAAPAALVTTPFDLVKTRLQASPVRSTATQTRLGRAIFSPEHVEPISTLSPEHAEPISGLSPFAAVAAISHEEGTTALFRGGLERVLRSAPQFAITLSLSDVLKAKAHAMGWL